MYCQHLFAVNSTLYPNFVYMSCFFKEVCEPLKGRERCIISWNHCT